MLFTSWSNSVSEVSWAESSERLVKLFLKKRGKFNTTQFKVWERVLGFCDMGLKQKILGIISDFEQFYSIKLMQWTWENLGIKANNILLSWGSNK